MDYLGELVMVKLLVLISQLWELLWFPFFVISSSKIISKKGFCFRSEPELLAAIVVGLFWILEPCQVHCALHSALSIVFVSSHIQPTPTQSASSHAMLQRLKKPPLRLVVLLHVGAVVVCGGGGGGGGGDSA